MVLVTRCSTLKISKRYDATNIAPPAGPLVQVWMEISTEKYTSMTSHVATNMTSNVGTLCTYICFTKNHLVFKAFHGYTNQLIHKSKQEDSLTWVLPTETTLTDIIHFFLILVDTCPFMGSLTPLFWTSGDVSSDIIHRSRPSAQTFGVKRQK